MIFPWCHNCHFCAINKRVWVHRKFNVSFVWRIKMVASSHGWKQTISWVPDQKLWRYWCQKITTFFNIVSLRSNKCIIGLFFKGNVTQVVGMMICYAMTGAWESFSKVELLSSSLNCWCISVYRNIMFHEAKLMSEKNRKKALSLLLFSFLSSLISFTWWNQHGSQNSTEL